jgi:peptidoglycan/LPS O-acetylase OafA/YrhL
VLVSRPAVIWSTTLLTLLVVAGLAPTFVRPAGAVTYTVGYSALALFYSCFLLLTLSQEKSFVIRWLQLSWLRYLGGISYCIYIVHLTINQWAHALLLHSQPELNDLRGVGVTLLSVLVTWTVAATSWRYLEAPAIAKGHEYVY